MTPKHDRLAELRRIVRAGGAATQRELLTALRRRGGAVDQSTLSRDLAELGVRKVEGRYRLPEARNGNGAVDHAPAVRRIVPCGPNLVVIKTTTGEAQPVALTIDAAADPSIVATLAGDDTVFVATRTRRTQTVALRRLRGWFRENGE